MGSKKEIPDYIGHRKRLKQRFKKSPHSFYDYELLELLLGYALPRKDTKPIAKALLKRFGSLKETLYAPEDQLKEIQGISDGLVLFFQVVKEFISRIEIQDLIQKRSISGPKDVFEHLKHTIGILHKEVFYILLLNTKNKIIWLEKVCDGTIDHVNIYPREIIEIIIKKKAANVILIHNHPGGDPNPSKEDIELTTRLKKILTEINVHLLDHIIITPNYYFSLKENNLC